MKWLKLLRYNLIWLIILFTSSCGKKDALKDGYYNVVEEKIDLNGDHSVLIYKALYQSSEKPKEKISFSADTSGNYFFVGYYFERNEAIINTMGVQYSYYNIVSHSIKNDEIQLEINEKDGNSKSKLTYKYIP